MQAYRSTHLLIVYIPHMYRVHMLILIHKLGRVHAFQCSTTRTVSLRMHEVRLEQYCTTEILLFFPKTFVPQCCYIQKHAGTIFNFPLSAILYHYSLINNLNINTYFIYSIRSFSKLIIAQPCHASCYAASLLTNISIM